jgi:hypothetical protein
MLGFHFSLITVGKDTIPERVVLFNPVLKSILVYSINIQYWTCVLDMGPTFLFGRR